ncbi:hypothetical protein BN1221_04555c [Brenneria goodwinii]|uniref:Uncharacterized protein n=1 Tax=Brenneria goodwinii TaxID=1109412 RepID=A0A0G4K1Q9_9GAMM|nr:hypothetical protein BN1221_04555c [Brenneria goodwinii]
MKKRLMALFLCGNTVIFFNQERSFFRPLPSLKCYSFS